MGFELYLINCATNIKQAFGVISIILLAYTFIKVMVYVIAIANRDKWGTNPKELKKRETFISCLVILLLFVIACTVLFPSTEQYNKIINQKNNAK